MSVLECILSAAEEIMMQAIWVKIRIKPTERQRFLHAIELDALGSERDEPGCPEPVNKNESVP
jgi:hypothetical protein